MSDDIQKAFRKRQNGAPGETLVFPGIFLMAMSVLVLEISLTRILSISLWYHFAFLVISMALLGYGIAGVLLTYLPSLRKLKLNDLLSILAFSLTCVIPLCFWILTKIPVEPYEIVKIKQFIYMMLYYIVGTVPFIVAGLGICAAVDGMSHRIYRLYFFDLLGAGAGCFLVIVLFPILGGEGVTLISALIASAAAMVLAFGSSSGFRKAGIAQFIVVGAFLLSAGSQFEIHIPPSKTLGQGRDRTRYPNARTVYTEWNAISRVDVWERGTPEGWAWGLSPAYEGRVQPIMLILQDADAGTPIYNLPDGDISKLEFINYTPSSLIYQIKKNADVLIVGPGGGIDIASALYNEAARTIDAVEINPITIDIMMNRFSDYGGRIYHHPMVDVHLGEGRHFIRRTEKLYDIMQLTLVDTWAATLSGAYSLSENYLYTLEAMVDYLSHLRPAGMLSISRWLLDPPRESLRLCVLATHALEREGATSPAEHLAVLSSKNLVNVIIKRTPFTNDELSMIEQTCSDRGFGVLHLSGREYENEFSRYLRSSDKSAFESQYTYDITSTSDNKPFFFQYYRWRNLASFFGEFRNLEDVWDKPVGHLVLLGVFVQSILFVILFIILPLLLTKKVLYSAREVLPTLTYFLLIGIGFMFVEISLMQKFILFLGHPMYSLAVVLASFLVFSGFGSFAAGKLLASSHRNTRAVPVVLAALIGLYILLLPWVFDMFLRFPLSVRILLTLLLLAPLGFLMGMPFPLGIDWTKRSYGQLIPWSWAVNACASVLGSVLCVIFAMSWGFSAVLLLAALCYLGTLGTRTIGHTSR